MVDLISRQPFSAVYIICIALVECGLVPLSFLQYLLLPSTRPRSEWTLKQAIMIRIMNRWAKTAALIQINTKLSLKPGKEGNRFQVISPSTDSEHKYKGPMLDSEIVPQKLGLTWHPVALSQDQSSKNGNADVVLHFHGGAYVFGSGRDIETAYTASLFMANGITHVVCPQYRLSSKQGGRFPAALQDALTAYLYLLNLGVPSSRIIFSGDSAGGNLAMSLLRYIHEFGAELHIPWPGCVWLWSPWVDVAAGLDRAEFRKSKTYDTDIVGKEFAYWGASTIARNDDVLSPYLNPKGNPFPSRSPVFIQAGDAEVIYHSILGMAQDFESCCDCHLLVSTTCPHDIISGGSIIGFGKEAEHAAREACDFLRKHRFETS